jgi:hypothetical protein
MANNNIVLISGKSSTGKSASLRNIKNPEGVMYLGCENNKELPFPHTFKAYTITDPMQIYDGFVAAEANPAIHTIVVDTLTFMMDLFESMYVLTSANTMKSWGDYAQFFKNLMSQYVANSTKRVVFLGHTLDVVNESEMLSETLVKVKGSLMNTGIEAFFTTVVSTKKVPLSKLNEMSSPLLNISEDEDMLGFKYVYQTRLTKETVNERIRGPLGMWDKKETFIDNDIQNVLDRIEQYYGPVAKAA